MEVMGFEMQLNALYKSQDLAAQKMQQIHLFLLIFTELSAIIWYEYYRA